jgi:hypothetical protein
MRTPVDTGRARGNWTATVGHRSAGSTDGVDPIGGSTVANAQAVANGWDGNGSIFLTNNLPYIERLEHGHSGQAPSGMVGITVAEFGGIVDGAAR